MVPMVVPALTSRLPNLETREETVASSAAPDDMEPELGEKHVFPIPAERKSVTSSLDRESNRRTPRVGTPRERDARNRRTRSSSETRAVPGLLVDVQTREVGAGEPVLNNVHRQKNPFEAGGEVPSRS